MAAIAIDMHLDIRHADRQHRVEVFDGPDRMAAVNRSGRCDECLWNVAWNRWGSAIEREGRGTGIDDAHVVGTRSYSGKRIVRVVVLLVEVIKKDRGRC